RNIVKVISISILYFNLGAGDDYVYYGATEFRGLHTRKPLPVKERVYLPDGKFRMRGKNIFPEYYLINVERFKDVIENDLDEWIYMLKHETLRDDFHAPNIDKARKKLALLKMSPEERKRYERYMTNLAIERDVIETAKAEGEKKGRMKERMEVLLKLYQNGMSVEQISAATGFDVAKTRELLRLGEENDDAKD
ncbi:MAG: hypothetical protein GY862_09655, partial [Gammaproteobacteria bacterium]|nr:hypothetical protein [Gammaproteobacteria bacterium]